MKGVAGLFLMALTDLTKLNEVRQFENLELLARQVVEGFIIGLHRSPFHGFSVEFAEHRQYNKGESTKHIDWKLFARTEKLFVKKYEEETNLRSQIVLDVSSSMLYPWDDKKRQSKLYFSLLSAAALVFLLRKQRDAVGLSLFTDKLELHTSARMSGVHARMIFAELNKLLHVDANSLNRKTSTAAMLHQIAENTHKRSLVVIFSDMFSNQEQEDIFPALQHLRYNGHEVILFHVTDHETEVDFSFKNRPYRFVDMETGDEMKLNPNEIREHYKEKVEGYFKEIKMKCGQYGIDLAKVDVKDPFAEVLMSFLIKRGRLF
jgi:uncharacterized protein (DUF58 family)